MPDIDKVIVIAGAARSGTSWLGEIFNSSPAVEYRFQPLFSYAFKGRLNEDSSLEEMQSFFEELYQSQDEFLLQKDKRDQKIYPVFPKVESPSVLAFKTCRYQYVVPRLLEMVDRLFAFGIVRHPCAVMNSWIRNPKEFPPGSDVRKEWRFGACKNEGRQEEFFGYYKWKEIANLYLDLQQKYPKRFMVVKYEALAANPSEFTREMYRFAGLELTPQTTGFVEQSTTSHSDSPYSVFKTPQQVARWKDQLDPYLQERIYADLEGTRLEQFLK